MLLPVLKFCYICAFCHISLCWGRVYISICRKWIFLGVLWKLIWGWYFLLLIFFYVFFCILFTLSIDTYTLTHGGRVTHMYVNKLTIRGPDNVLSSDRRPVIIWTNSGLLLISNLGTNFSENTSEIHIFSFSKMSLKISSAKWPPFCLGLNVLNKHITRTEAERCCLTCATAECQN